MRFDSIKKQLTLWFGISVFVFLIAAIGIADIAVIHTIRHENENMLNDRIEEIISILQFRDDPLEVIRRRFDAEWTTHHSELIYIRIVATNNSVMLQSPNFPDLQTETSTSGPSDTRFNQARDGQTFLTVVKNLPPDMKLPGGSTIWAVLNLQLEKELLQRFQIFILSILVVALLLSVFAGAKLAAIVIGPFQEIIATTNRVTSSSLSERIPFENLPIEFKELAQTVNAMLDRLSDSLLRLQRFSADLAHELRTPINNIQGEIEVSLRANRNPEEYRDVLASALEEIERLSRLIDSLLFLARTENPERNIQREVINLKRETDAVLDFYLAAASEKDITITLSVPEDLRVGFEKTLFHRLIANLLSNAINYTDINGKIEVEAKSIQSGGRLMTEIKVKDTGRGISPADLDKVFDRFFRTDPSRQVSKYGGFGLGLTIAQQIVKIHGGSIHIESEERAGTTVVMNFPMNMTNL